MSKRTRRQRRQERAARETAKAREEQAELLDDDMEEHRTVEGQASERVAPESTGLVSDDARRVAPDRQAQPVVATEPISAQAELVMETITPEPSSPHAESPPAAPPLSLAGSQPLSPLYPEPLPPFVSRPKAVPFEAASFEFDEEDERTSPVEFELVMVEDRPKKGPRIDRRSRVRVDEEHEKDLEASAEHLVRARELVREGRIEEAMELYRGIVSDHPQSLKARNNLGVLYDELGQHERALEQFEFARSLSPDNVEVLANMGSALLGLARFEDAERELRRAQKIDPESLEVRANLGILYHRRGLYAQAETELRWVCERDHDHGPAHFYRGEALNRLGRVDQALEVLERAMRLQPSNSKIYHMMGILFDKKHMPVEAAQMYKKMRELRS